MKNIGVLNQDISAVAAGMGHMDTITVADAGLPIPDGVRRIDLALREGLLGFLETVETLAGGLQVEKVVVAQETGAVSPHIEEGLKQIFPIAEWATVPHEDFKALTRQSKSARARAKSFDNAETSILSQSRDAGLLRIRRLSRSLRHLHLRRHVGCNRLLSQVGIICSSEPKPG
jgi:D-ribose pyranase